MSMIAVTKENYDEVMSCGKTVLLDFWATWCGPCRMVAPILEEIDRERKDIQVGKIDVDSQMELAMKFGVTAIPTLVVMENGAQKAKAVGYMPKEKILALVD